MEGSMAVVLPLPDAALVDRFAHGDENALIALYRQEYDGLLAMAKEALGPDLAAYRGKIAHAAMLDTWAARARFESPLAVAAFLEEAVRQEAHAQRRKHAALHHRPGASSSSHLTVPDVDGAVRALMDALHTPVDHEAAVREAREAQRLHAREHVERVVDRPRWMLYAGLAVLAAVVLFFGQRLLDGVSRESALDAALGSTDAQVLSSGRGQRGALTLRDGTRAMLGSDTRLRVPSAFGNTLRTISLEGTATFTPTPAAAHARGLPFAVRAGALTLTAQGTVFSVRHFPGENGSVLAVAEGAVEIRHRANGSTHRVEAGQTVRFTDAGVITPLDLVARDVALAWTRDSMVFSATPLRLVVPELVRWYGMNAIIADSSLLDRPVTMRIPLTSSGEATDALTRAAGLAIQFGKNDRIEFVAAPPKVESSKRR
jgi:ferric-dicitrate binding protein FerR (iron transport regulator)